MIKNKTHRIVTAGLFVAIGLILPYFTAHAFGMQGTVILPMHIPVLLCGLLCGPQFGALCGIIVPILSSLLTGMPPIYPMLPVMLVQLFIMGLISGLMYEKVKLNVFLSVFIAMVSGWVIYGLTFAALMFAGNGGFTVLSVVGAVVQGLPGIVIQLILIPAIVAFIQRYFNLKKQNLKVPALPSNPIPDAQTAEALKLINSGRISCVIIKDESVIHTADGRGVSPLLRVYANEPEMLKGAYVVDKIIGKAAAMILVLGRTKRAYGMIMSAAGREYLERHGITAEFGRCVDVISNRERNGICPIEKSVMDIDDPEEGLKKISAAVDNLMRPAINQ